MTGPTVPAFHPTDGDVQVAGPVHSDCPYTSIIGRSRAAKKSKHSFAMGAAPVIRHLASVRPRTGGESGGEGEREREEEERRRTNA